MYVNFLLNFSPFHPFLSLLPLYRVLSDNLVNTHAIYIARRHFLPLKSQGCYLPDLAATRCTKEGAAGIFACELRCKQRLWHALPLAHFP